MERADFHGHPILHPKANPEFGLEGYVKVALREEISIPPVTAFTGYYQDNRFEEFYRDETPKTWHKERFREGFVVYSDIGERVIFLRGQEIVTKLREHLLLVGLPYNLQSLYPLEEALEEANDLNAIVIADHPLVTKRRGGLGRENVIKYKESICALESNSQMKDLLGFLSFGPLKVSRLNEAVYRLGSEIGLPVVANSDFHMSYLTWLPFFRGSLASFGYAYNEFEKLGNKKDNWMQEIKEKIQKHEFTIFHKYIGLLDLWKWAIPSIISSASFRGLKDIERFKKSYKT